MTKFEQAKADVKAKNSRLPKVNLGGKEVDYFHYQLSVHKFNLRLLAKGIKFNGVKLKDLKDYYGLKGRSASECLPQFLEIIAEHKRTL
jgi:hypothetical protein